MSSGSCFVDGLIAGAAIMAMAVLAIEIYTTHQAHKRARRFTHGKH